jgi:hypothetical protein
MRHGMKTQNQLARLVFAAVLCVSTASCAPDPQPPARKNRTPDPLQAEVPTPGPRRSPLNTSNSRDLPEDLSAAIVSAGLPQGLTHRKDRLRKGPWSINLLLIDRSSGDLEFATTLGGNGRVLGLSRLSEQIKSFPLEEGHPLAAINGDFYRTEHHRYAGDPRGLQIMHGELVSAPAGRTSFWIDSNDQPQIGEVASKLNVTWPDGTKTRIGLNEERRENQAVLYSPTFGDSTRTSGGIELVLARHASGSWLPLRPGITIDATVHSIRKSGNTTIGDNNLVLSFGPALIPKLPQPSKSMALKISTATQPDLAGVRTAIGGGPLLVSGGKALPISASRSNDRHPRSAVGWNDSFYFFVQVDGRQPGFSVGMTLPELASYLVKQGCHEAMNLDGGGSSEIWIYGEIANRPCYGHERDTANALLVVRKNQGLGR